MQSLCKRQWVGFFWSFGAVASLLACGDGPSRGEPTSLRDAAAADGGAMGDAGQDNETVGGYLRTLPSWSTFSPPLEDGPPAPIPDREPVVTVEKVTQKVAAASDAGAAPADAGRPDVVRDVVYDCTETPYSLTSSPQKLIVNDPNRDVLYPGAMIQGVTHRDGASIGDVLPLTITKRAPIRVSVPDVANADGENYRLVAPNQAEVSQAVGDIVGNATREDLATPSSISFEMKTYHSEKQFALEAGMSGRYLGFTAAASGSVERDASKTTVAVQFTQRMYTVAVEPPGPTAASFFSEDFSQADLDELVAAGRIGPENLPLYVSSVVYGRMMTFAMTSTASASEIRAALRASYETFTGGVRAELSARHKQVLQESSVVLSTLGGDAADALRVVRSGDWKQYFDQKAALSTAVPLSYTFKNLGDSSIASVSESTEYTIKTCTARQATPGVFDLPAVQSHSLELGPISDVMVANINGDGYDDLVYNSRSDKNRVSVLLGNADGRFTKGPALEHPEHAPPGSWHAYQLRAGDVDGDGDDDLVWNYNRSANGQRRNVLFVALSGNGTDGSFALAQHEAHDPAGTAANYPMFLGDVNGDGMADVIWTSVPVVDGSNWIHLGLATGGGSFRVVDQTYQTFASGRGWSAYQAHVGDFNGDGLVDLMWNAVADARNDVWLAPAKPSMVGLAPEAVDLEAAFGKSLFQWPADWRGYHDPITTDGLYTLTGDIDGKAGLDLVWIRRIISNMENTSEMPSTKFRVYAVQSDGTSFVKSATSEQGDDFEQPSSTDTGELTLLLADVAGDDKADLIVSEAAGAENRIYVGLSRGDGRFDYSPAMQRLVLDASDSSAFGQYQVRVGNFGGSSKADLVWVLPTAQSRIYSGISK